MMLTKISLCFVIAAALGCAQTAPPPQRTQTSRPTNTATPKSPTPPADAAGALDSLSNSLQDLNAIRDGNLTRVQKDGCPPDVSARLAELRAKLAEVSGDAPAKPAEKTAADPQAIAAAWFKPAPSQPPAPKPVVETRESKQLADVLPEAPAAKPVAPARQDNGAEIARLKAEITRLSGTCKK